MPRLFNTMAQHVEEFVPREPGKVGLYVCGVTPYDTAHLGHAFVFATFDTLVRYLRWLGNEVTYVQNITDIDDPLFEKAKALGNITWDELAKQETERLVREMLAINVATPDHFVRASDELPAMFALIERLLANGNAYQNDGWLYFSVKSDPEFGTLAAAAGLEGYDRLLAVANENGNDGADPRKHDPLDFLLWRGATAGEPSWPSPWGPGRPGWHIECSAMATHYLGSQVDIHGGGTDLIFPHHTCEIAQSEFATGTRPYVREWMHVGLVAQDGTKMSKSLGNLTIVGKLLETYTPDAVRVLLLSHHYRKGWEFFADDMLGMQELADELTQAVEGEQRNNAVEPDSLTGVTETKFREALENDLDTPHALAALGHLAQAIMFGNLPIDEIPAARFTIVKLSSVLGLRLRQDI